MRGTCGMRMPKRTSLEPPSRAMERLATAAGAAPACPATSEVELRPLAATAASA